MTTRNSAPIPSVFNEISNVIGKAFTAITLIAIVIGVGLITVNGITFSIKGEKTAQIQSPDVENGVALIPILQYPSDVNSTRVLNEILKDVEQYRVRFPHINEARSFVIHSGNPYTPIDDPYFSELLNKTSHYDEVTDLLNGAIVSFDNSQVIVFKMPQNDSAGVTIYESKS